MNKMCIYHTFEAELCCNFTVEVFCTLTLISVCEVIKIEWKVFFYTFDGILPWEFCLTIHLLTTVQ